MLVSLTAPKLCSKRFDIPHHFLGGRFVPPSIVSKYELKLPPYPDTSMCVRIGEPTRVDQPGVSPPKCIDKSVEADPFVQFQKWFDVASAAGLKDPDAMALSTATKDVLRFPDLKTREDTDSFQRYSSSGKEMSHPYTSEK
ncbi:Pyridoxine/pyridoxamine 5'-phosphate oxidase 1, chloroplastic, variant 2 [Salvia divinorum]|uniref:Pyridoxine/pyridoxamine 5'-phosphate oxidase 1, chloroplastic, variant 2 n=1 Tax=Salvia divinorum TaxID=28513 RepID=A0ABD1IGF1_SALDI